MVSILVVVIVCTLFYCVYCWRWRKRNGEFIQHLLHLFLYSCTGFCRVSYDEIGSWSLQLSGELR
jgi:hypothetical protein